MSKSDIKIMMIGLFTIAVIVAICVSVYKYNTYYVKDVEVVEKIITPQSSGNNPDYYIIIEKGDRKAKLEVDSGDYLRMQEGQHINASVKKSTGYMRRYQLVME